MVTSPNSCPTSARPTLQSRE